jgi:hypothetical protein
VARARDSRLVLGKRKQGLRTPDAKNAKRRGRARGSLIVGVSVIGDRESGFVLVFVFGMFQTSNFGLRTVPSSWNLDQSSRLL